MRPVFIKAKPVNTARFRWRPAAIKRSSIWVAMCLSLAGLASFAQQTPPSQGRDVTKLYAEKCASCHGTDMTGGSASSLVDGIWRHGGDDSSIAASIRNGHPDEGMPPMEKDFDAPEIRGL